jgi:hypothetical protein
MAPSINRRVALRWMLTAYGALKLPSAALAAGGPPTAPGYGGDPDLLRVHGPGELWPLILDERARAVAAVLCDLILPADGRWPSASSVGVVDFLDEWVSAPYPPCREDRAVIVEGLRWLDRMASAEAPLDTAVFGAIWDAQASAADADSEGAAFLERFRRLTAIGYYTTPIGMEDIGYTGNRPSADFEGPPREALERAGVRLPPR